MVDLTAQPFALDAAAVAWVYDTIASMTLEEKIGQLFINLNTSFAPEYLDRILDEYHVGGMRYMGSDSATVQKHIRYAQSRSKLPLLIASNPEMGGFGSADDGTLVSTHLQAGSFRTSRSPGRWDAWPRSRPRRWAATGRSRPSWTSPTTGATP